MSDYRLKQDYHNVKAGTISEEWRDHSWNPVYVFKDNDIELDFNKEEINELLKNDIVEKLPEPKWRDEDMIEFAETMVLVARLKGDVIPITKEDYINGINVYEKNRQTRDI